MKFSDKFKQRYGWGGWDDPRPQSECLMCRGTGHAGGNINDPNECGFCIAEEQCSRCAELERELIKERERLKKALAILDKQARNSSERV